MCENFIYLDHRKSHFCLPFGSTIPWFTYNGQYDYFMNVGMCSTTVTPTADHMSQLENI